MAAPASVDEFLDLVRKSGVADEKRLDTYLLKMRAGMPNDQAKVAALLIQDGLLTNFQAENILLGKWRRFAIGKYKILEKLGVGGFAQVYLCEHKMMRRRVAVKVLPVAYAKDKNSSVLKRFQREAQAAAQLDHPNLVHAYDIDQDGELHFIVMEYVDGANLQEIVSRTGRLNVARACHYIRHTAFALEHAHESGLIHRDIKPGNVLVDRAGIVKVLDLGLTLIVTGEDENLTKKHDDGAIGTADYLSPEQSIDAHDVDIRTDIYSLGVTFYFLLTGQAPFEGLSVTQKLMAHQTKTPRSITEFRKDVPAGLLAIINKMMAKNRVDRYANAGEVADALEPFTTTAIAPPSEAELPKLSPAATGGSTVVVRPPAATPAPQPAAAVAVQPKIAAEPLSDTDDAAAKTDTTPFSVEAPAPPAPPAPRPVLVGVVLVSVIVAVLCLATIIAGAAWFFWPTAQPRGRAEAERVEPLARS